MFAIFLFQLVLQGLIPLLLLRGLRGRKFTSPRDWLLSVAPQALYFLFIVVVLPWGHLPYALRVFWPLLFTFVAAKSWTRMRRSRRLPAEPETVAADGTQEALPEEKRSSLFSQLVSCVVAAVVFGRPVVDALRARRVPEPPLELAFPLREGVYVVGHGGSHTSVNYHNASETQRYALDISELNTLGMRALGFGPTRLERYAIFGDTLHSPCDATVRAAVDDLPDHTPPNGDEKNPAGNHVELEVNGVRIFLAHMQRGSVRVRKGDRVRRGDPLGKVGNSGNTSEPHLHIHAVRGGSSLYDGVGVPLTFQGRFLVRNDLVWGL